MASFNVLAIRYYEDSPGDTYLYPGLGDRRGQAFAPEPADGDNIKMHWSSYVCVNEPGRKWTGGGKRIGAGKRISEASPLAGGFTLARTPARAAVYVTDSRVVLCCEELEKAFTAGSVALGLIGLWSGPAAAIEVAAETIDVGKTVHEAKVDRDHRRAAGHTVARGRKGKVMVGQVRYEWIKRIGANVPAWGNRTVALEYADGETIKAVRLYLSQLAVEPVVLAQDIVRRAAALRLRQNAGLTPDQRSILEQLINADILHPAPKKMAYYDLPASQVPRQSELHIDAEARTVTINVPHWQAATSEWAAEVSQ